MKTQTKKVSVIAIAVLMMAGSNLYAQRGRNNNRQAQPEQRQEQRFNQRQSCQILDLTEEQEAKINDLRIEQIKEMTASRNQMNELQAKKQTLMSTGNSDLKELNAVIDQMTDVQNKRMKTSVKHHQDVRNLLTDEQKVIFDSRPMNRQGSGNKAGRGGRGNRQGMGQNSGYGNGINQGSRAGLGRGMNQ